MTAGTQVVITAILPPLPERSPITSFKRLSDPKTTSFSRMKVP